MGVTVCVADNIIEQLKNFAKDGSFSFGLLITQKFQETFCVTHLAPLLSPIDPDEQADKASQTKGTSISSLSNAAVATHASQVTRMLPGGLDIAGVFLTCPSTELCSTSNQGKLRQILEAVHKVTSKYYLGTTESNKEKVVVFRCTQSSKVGAKCLDLSEHGTSLASCNFKIQQPKLIQLNYTYMLTSNAYITKEKESLSLYKNVLSFLRPWAQSLENVLLLANGQLLLEEDLIQEHAKLSKGKSITTKDAKVIEIQMLENGPELASADTASVIDCCGSILQTGTIAGRAFLDSAASTRDVVDAVRCDLIRSAVSRWEMHCDSLVDEPIGPTKRPVLHEPPRRVFIKDCDWAVPLCDYLFPGDAPQDACQSAKELFNVDIDEGQVEDSIEEWADPYSRSPPSTPTTSMFPSDLEDDTSAKSSLNSQLNNTNSILAFLAVLCVVLAVFYACNVSNKKVS